MIRIHDLLSGVENLEFVTHFDASQSANIEIDLLLVCFVVYNFSYPCLPRSLVDLGADEEHRLLNRLPCRLSQRTALEGARVEVYVALDN